MLLSDDLVSDLLCPDVRLRQHRRVWRSPRADSAVATPMMRSRSYLSHWELDHFHYWPGSISISSICRVWTVRSNVGPRGRGQIWFSVCLLLFFGGVEGGRGVHKILACLIIDFVVRYINSYGINIHNNHISWRTTALENDLQLLNVKASFDVIISKLLRFEGCRSISRPDRTSCAIHRWSQTRGYHTPPWKCVFKPCSNLGNGGKSGFRASRGSCPLLKCFLGKKKSMRLKYD